MTVPFDSCTVCGRILIERGEKHVIEAAFDRANQHPAVNELVAMLEHKRSGVRAIANDMLLLIEDFADTGTAEIPRQLNELRDGIWELKAQKFRLPFYYSDTDCATVRLTHGFMKNTEKTPLRHIDIAKAIRKEDEVK